MAVTYDRTVWINDQEPAINAKNLNNIETGIVDLTDNVNDLLEDMDEIHQGIKISKIEELNAVKQNAFIYGPSNIIDELNGSWTGINLYSSSQVTQIFSIKKSTQNYFFTRICTSVQNMEDSKHWTILEIPNADKLFYKDEETVSLSGYATGLVTSSGTSLRFDIPLAKSITNIKKVDLSLSSLIARSQSVYLNNGELPALTKITTSLRASTNSIHVEINRYADADLINTKPWYTYEDEEISFSSIFTVGELVSSGKTIKFEIPLNVAGPKDSISTVTATISSLSARADGVSNNIASGSLPNTVSVSASYHKATNSVYFQLNNSTEWRKDNDNVINNKIVSISVSGTYKVSYKNAYVNNEVTEYTVNGTLTMHTENK